MMLMFSQIEGWIDSLFDKLIAYGPLGIIFLALLFVGKKYLPVIVDAIVAFLQNLSIKVDKISESSERQADSTEQLTELNRKQADTLTQLCRVSEQHHDPRGAAVYANHIFSNVDTNKALRLIAQAKAMETHNESARRLLDEAITLLTPK